MSLAARGVFALVLLSQAVLGGVIASAGDPAAVDRGRLSMAWDAHDSGRFEEALTYLCAIPDQSPMAADARWLQVECLYDLGRHADAADLLESQAGQTLPEREALALDIFWDWAWSCTRREAYAEALAVLQRGLSVLPGEPFLAALAAATEFRGALGRRLRGEAVDLPGGVEVEIRSGRSPPRGGGWVQVFPWRWQYPWVPEGTLEDWMPARAAELGRDRKTLWLRVPTLGVVRQIEAAGRAAGLQVEGGAHRLALALGAEREVVEPAEWGFRAAVEGLGVEGAARRLVAEATRSLEAKAELVAWVCANGRDLGVIRDGDLLRLQNPRSGRQFAFDPAAWTGLFQVAKEWDSFWSELVVELARPARAYRCFCGRETVLREMMVEGPGDAAVFEKARGYAVTLAAQCPLHQQWVTEGLLQEWQVESKAAWARAQWDARNRPWRLSFQRGEEDGYPYLALEGDGAASLVRAPELLLGALEAVDGVEMRRQVVQVVAPSSSLLVIAREEVAAAVAESAAGRTVLGIARRGERPDRLDYRATVRLPQCSAGSFDVVQVE